MNPRFNHGAKEIEIHELQVLHGLLQFGCVACPALRPEMGAIARLLGTCDPTRLMVRPRGGPVEVEQVWQ